VRGILGPQLRGQQWPTEDAGRNWRRSCEKEFQLCDQPSLRVTASPCRQYRRAGRRPRAPVWRDPIRPCTSRRQIVRWAARRGVGFAGLLLQRLVFDTSSHHAHSGSRQRAQVFGAMDSSCTLLHRNYDACTRTRRRHMPCDADFSRMTVFLSCKACPICWGRRWNTLFLKNQLTESQLALLPSIAEAVVCVTM
jgi:hypothetical protein